MQALEDLEDLLRIFRRDSNAVVLHRKYPFRFPPLRRDVDARRILSPIFDRVAHQVLHQLHQANLVRVNGGYGVPGNHRAALLHRGLQVQEHLADDIDEIHCVAWPLRRGSGLGVSQQILEQHLHPPRAAHHIRDVLVGIGIQLSEILALQHLAVQCHHAKWLLQIVTGGVGELVQIVIGLTQGFVRVQQFLGTLGHALLQRGVQFANRLIRAPALGNIANGRCQQQTFFGLQRAQADFNGELMAALPFGPQLHR